MKCVRVKFILPGALALLLLAVTGCSKEDVVAPILGGDAPGMELKAGGIERDTIQKPEIGVIRANPISDDGDDLGDKESSSKPRAN